MRFVSLIPKLVGRGALWRSVLLPAGAFLLLTGAGLSSSSEADEPLFTRSAQQLERLWSGVLGCTHPGEGAPRAAFETTLDGAGGAPSAVRHDYVECGKRALRNASSRMLVQTIEDSLRRGGVALAGERFRLDANIGWVWDENVSGEIEALVPLLDREKPDGTGQVLFLQPGAIFWQGLESEERVDANLGLVYRRHISPGVISGWSVFYDHDFKREHQRAGVGFDIQSGALHAALNYYHPLNEWQEGRPDYEEQPLQGADFRLGLAWSRIRFDASVGAWRFEGEEEESEKWRAAFEVGAGLRLLPGVFLEGGYEQHDADNSLDSRWSAGLSFRFSLPGFEGAATDRSMEQADFWEPVKREKRILYEEREAIPPVRLTPRTANNEPLTSDVAEGDTVTITGELAVLPVQAMLNLVVDDESTAELGIDFDYGHRVYELDGETGGQSAPADTVNCPDATCVMTVPAGVTRFDIEVDVLEDATLREVPEEIILRVDVPEEYQRMIRGGRTTVTIEGHGNTVGFDPDSSDDELAENAGEAVVTVNVDLPSPTPIVLQIEASGTAQRGTDYSAPESLAIPAGAGSATFTLTGIDNNDSEGNRTITLTLSGDLPPGWEYVAHTHDLTLRDDDLSIGFTGINNPTLVDENDGTVELTVAANQPLPAAAAVAWSLDLSGDAAAGDFTGSTGGTLNFQQGDAGNDFQTITLSLNNDTAAEDAEEVVVTLNETGSSLPDGWSLGAGHRFTIDSNDGTVTFADASTSLTINEGGTSTIRISSTAEGPRNGYPLTVSFSPSASGEINFPQTVNLPAGENEASFSITVNQDNTTEEAQTYTMSLGSGASAPAGWTVSSTRSVTVPLSDGRISFADATITAAEGGSAVETTLTMDPPPTANITIPMEITGDAQEGTDYTRTLSDNNGSGVTYRNGVVYPANATSVTFSVSALEDADGNGESNTYTITSFPAGYSAGANGSLRVVLNDNDIGDVQFAATGLDGSANEGESVTLTVQASTAATAPLPLNWTVSPAAEVDTASGTVTVAQGGNSATFSVAIADPGTPDPEAPEDVTVTLTDPNLPPGWSLGARRTHTINIPANDRRITFSAADTVFEAEGHYDLILSLNDDAAAALPIRISASTPAGVTITSPDVPGNWNNASGIYTIPAGTSASGGAKVRLDFPEDGTFDDNTYRFTFEEGPGFPSGEGWDLVNTSFALTVNDPEADTVGFAVSSGSVNRTRGDEGDTITLTVRSSVAAPASGLQLPWTVNESGDGSNDDIATDSGTVTIQSGGSSATFDIVINQDPDPESVERVQVTLDDSQLPAAGWRLGRRTHDIAIAAEDNTIKFASASATVAENAGVHNVAVEIDARLDTGTVLNITRGGSATFGSGNDYTVGDSITLPARAGTVNIPVTINDDNLVGEGDETIELTIEAQTAGEPAGWTVVAPTTHILTITDNDTGTIGFVSDSSSAPESGSAATHNIPVTVSGMPANSFALAVDVTGGSNPATQGAGNDFTGPATLNISNSGQANLVVEILPDADPEADETIVLEIPSTLSDGFSPDPQARRHTITIPANDRQITFSATDTVFEAEGHYDLNLSLNDDAAVALPIRISASTPAGVTITSPDVPGNWNNASGIYTIPSGTSASGGARVRLDFPEDPTFDTNTYEFTFSEGAGFPSSDGWDLVNTSFTLTVSDPESDTVGFAASSGSINRAVGDEGETITLTVRSSVAAPASNLQLPWSVNDNADGDDDIMADSGTVTIQSGDNSATFNIVIRQDTNPEDAERITVTLDDSSLPVAGWQLGTTTHEITIDSNDGVLTFADASTPVTADEGETRTIRVSSTAEGPRNGYPLTVSFSPSASGQISFPQTVRLPAGEKEATFDITVNQDNIPEAGQTYTMSLGSGGSAPAGWTVSSTRSVVVPVTDGRISFADASITAAEGGSAVATTLTMDPPPTANTTIAMSITGDAQEGTKYNRTLSDNNGNSVNYQNGVIYPAGATGVTFSVTALEDADRDGETDTYTITSFPDGYSAGANGSLEVVLDDNDIGDVQFAATGLDASADEGGSVTLRVESSTAATAPLPLTWTVSPAAEVDTASGTVTVAQGGNSATFNVVIADPVTPDPEAPEDVTVTLTDPNLPPGWSLGARTTHTITIPANDRQITFSATDTVFEAAGHYDLILSLNDDAASALPIRISASTPAGVTITSPDVPGNWNNASGIYTIPTGTSASAGAKVRLDFPEDADFNPNTYEFTLSEGASFPSSEGWDLVNTSFTLTVNDPEDETVGFAVSSGSVNRTGGDEGDTITLTVRSSVAAPASGLQLSWTVNESGDGSNDDIATDSGTVTIQSGSSSATFDIVINQDPDPESVERVQVTLDDSQLPAAGWRLGRRTHDIAIAAEDNRIKFASASGTVAENAGVHNVAVEIDARLDAGTVLNITRGGSATFGSGNDYTVGDSITLPARAGTVNIPVTINDDNLVGEGDETIELTIEAQTAGEPAGWTVVAPTTHTLTITDNDTGTIGFVSDSSSAPESGSAATHNIPVTVSGMPANSFALAVDVTGGSNPATQGAGNDFTGPATLNISNSGPANLVVEILPDANPEADETIVLEIPSTLSNGFSPDPQARQHTITIPANDRQITFSATDTVFEAEGHYDLNLSLNDDAAVALPIRIGASTPAGVTITSPDVPGNWNAGSSTYTIPANLGRSAKVRLDFPEDPTFDTNTYEFTLSEGAGFPSSEGWDLVNTSFTLMVSDPESDTVGFAASSGSINRAVGDEGETITLTVRSSVAAPASGLQLPWSVNDNADADDDIEIDDGMVTVSNGMNEATFDIVIRQDSDPEDAESVTVTLDDSSLPVAGWRLGTTTHEITIDSNDGTVTFADASTPVTADEGETRTIRVSSTVDGPVGDYPLTVSFSPSASGQISFPQTVRLPAGEKEATFDITVNQDNVPEAGQTYTMSLGSGASPPAGWTVSSTRNVVVPVTDGRIGFADASITAAEGGSAVATTLTMDPPPTSNTTIAMGITGNAQEGTKYTRTLSDNNGNSVNYQNGVIYPANATSVTFSVAALEDADRDNETDTYTITSFPAGYSAGANGSLEVVLDDNDIGDVQFATGLDASADEGDSVPLKIQASTAATAQLPLTWTVSPAGEVDTATGTVTIQQGDNEATFNVVIADPVTPDPEAPEDITVTLTDPNLPAGWILGTRTMHTIRISANDRQITFSATGTVFEVERHYDLTLSLNEDAAVALPIRIGASTPAGVTITSPDVPGNWNAGSSIYTIPANSGRSAKVRLDFPEDVDFNPNTYEFTLSEGANFPSSEGWDLVNTSFTLTVNDPETETVGFATSSGSVNRAGGNEGDTITLTVRSSVAATTDLVLPWIVNDNADNDDDIEIDDGMVTILNGMNEATFDIVIRQDSDPEDAESVTVTLDDSSLPVAGWQLGTTTHEITIDSNDGVLTFANASTPVTADEGETRTIRISSTVDGPVGNYPLTVSFSPDASGQINFPQTVDLPAGGKSASFTIMVNQDDITEAGQTYTMSLGSGGSAPAGWTVSSTRSVVVPVTDGRISFADATITAAEGGSAVATTLTMDPPPTSNTTIAMSITGNAQEGTKYNRTLSDNNGNSVTYQNGVIYPAGATGVTFSVSALEDMDRDDETDTYTITSFPDGYSAGANGSLQVVLDDNDIGDVQFATGLDASADEGGSVTLTVQASTAATAQLPLNWSVLPAAEVDTASGTVTIGQGNNNATFSVTIADPGTPDPEAPEDITVTLTGPNLPSGWTLGTRTMHTITISANDRQVTFSATDTVFEAEEHYDLTLLLNDDAAVALPIRITAPSDVTITSPDVPGNWDAASSTYTIPTGTGASAGAKVRLDFPEDVDFNTNTYRFTFSEGVNFPSSDGWSLVSTGFMLTVNDPEAETVGFATSSGSVNLAGGDEGDTVTLTVRSSVAANTDLVLPWTVNDEVDGDDDIMADSGTVMIQNGMNEATFDIDIRQDNDPEAAELVTVTLLDTGLPTAGWQLGVRTHDITIAADDNTIKFASASETINENAGVHNVVVEIDAPLDASAVLNITMGGNATFGSGNDYTVDNSITLPASAGTVNIPVTINDDNVFGEIDETIELTIEAQTAGEPEGWTVVSPATHTLTITDNDTGMIGFKEEGTRALEPAGAATSTHPVTLTIAGGTTGAESSFDVGYGGTADRVQQAGVLALDYEASETVTVPAGTTGDFTFNVTIRGDELPEIDETINITIDETRLPDYLSAVQNDTMHVVTIPANDHEVVFGNTTRVDEVDGREEMVTVSISQSIVSGSPDFVAPTGGVPLRISVLSSKIAVNGNFNAPPGADSGGEISFDENNPAVYFADIEIAEGQKEVVVPIYIVGDQDEDDEIITLQIEPQPGVTFPSEWGMVLRQRDGRVARFDRHSIHLTDTGILNPSGEIGFTLSESRAPESVDPHKIEFDTDAVIPPAGIEFKIGFTGGANNNNDIRYDGTFLNSTTASPFSATVMPGANSGDNPFITVDIANDAVSEADEVITFMIIGSMLPPLFTLDGAAAVHQLTIPANDNRARFAANANSATIDESTGQLVFEHDFMISLPDQPAPSPNLPLLLEITGGNDKGTATFNSDGTRDDDLEIRIPAHGTGAPVTVYLNRDQDIDDEEITFTLTEDTNFPDAWGIVPTSSNTYTLDITDTGPITPRIGFVDAMADVAEGDTHVVEFEINTLLPRAITLFVTGSATADSNDALYNGNNLLVGQTLRDETLAVNIQPPATPGDAPSISIQIFDDPDLEGAETITLHLHADNFTPGFEFGTRTHVINIAASDSLAHFPEGSDASTVQEGAGNTVLKVSLSGQPAPAPNLPLTLTATDSNGNPATVVSFMRSRAQHVLNFTIDEGATESEDLTVFLRFDNDTDQDVVTFTLTEGNNFPSAWGSVPAATNEYTLTIEDSGLVETGRVGFKDAGATVPETGSNITHPVALTVTGTVPADFSVPVRVASASTATAGAASPADFAAPGSVNITTADGGRDVTFNLTIFDNPRMPEDTETIVLEILQPDLPGQIRLGDNPTYTVTIPIHDQLVGFLASTTTADETAGSVTANLRVLQTYGTTPAGGVPVLVRIISGNEDGFVSLSQQHLHNERTYTIPGGRRNADIDVPVYFKIDEDNQPESIRLEIFEGENFPGDYALIPTTTTRFFDISITDTVSGGDPQVETVPFPSPMVGFAGVGTTVTEPGSGTTPVPVAVVVTDTVPSDFSLNIERGGVGDRLLEDYSIRQSLPLSISRGTTGTAETILVDITADTYAEYEEEITLTIPSEQALPANWVLGNASYKITIPANGNRVSFATDASTAVEDGATASVAVNIEQPFETDTVLALTLGGQTGDISVAVASTSPSGTAVYSGPDNTLTIPAGAQSVTLTVTATDDNDIETGNETATLTLGGTPPSGWTIAGNTVHTVTIPPNDLLAVGFAQTAEAIKAVEGGAAQQVNLSLPESAPSQVILQLAFSGAPESAYTIAAVAPAAYDPSAKTLTIASGASSAAFTVTANDNDGNTSDETLEISLSPGDVFPATWQVPADTSVDVVLDDSAQTTVGWASAGPLTLRENDVEMLALHISDPAPAGGLPLTLAAAGYADSASSITAAGAGDYEITTEATFTIAENGQTYAVGLTITDDPTAEMLEGLRLTLGKGTNFPEDWTLDPAVLDITIAVNDQHKIGFVQDGASTSFAEGESKMLGVELSQAHSADILVAVDVAPAGYADDIELAFDGTVLAANDHLTIDSNETQVNFEVRIKDDTILENEEMYTLTLRGVTTSPFPSEYSVDPNANTYTLTIQPSDVPVEFDSTVTEPVMLEEGGTPAMVGVRLPTPVAYPFNYDVSVVDAAGNDSLTDVSITATDSTKAVFDTTENSISVLANTSDFVLQIGATMDNIPEADETLTLKLLEGSREADTLQIRIAANGNSISLASPPASIPDLNEGEPYELVLDINAPLSAPAKLQIAALEIDNLGTDTSHRDYPVDLAFAVKAGETATFETEAGFTREFLERDEAAGIICPGFSRCARTTRGTLTIPAGVSQVTLLVTALSDGVAERDENVAVEITALTGADALPDAWSLDIPRETRFKILPNENRMNFLVGQGEAFERTVEEGSSHLLRVQQVRNFPLFEFNDNVVRAVLRVVETDSDELPEVTIRSGEDTSWDADTSTMTFTRAQSNFFVDVIDDDRREAEERVTLRLEQPTGADAYPSDAYDIGSNGTFTIIIPGGDNKISFASFDQSSQAAFAQGSIRACRGFHDGTNGSTENSARICAAEGTSGGFNYVRSIAIDAPLDAQARVRLSLDDQNEQTSAGEFQINLAGGNPQGTNWDERSGLLTIPAGASRINLHFEFYIDQEIHLPGDEDYLLTLGEVNGERLPTGWSIDGDASTLPIRILDFTGGSVQFNNSQAHHEEGGTARITMDISQTMPAGGIPIFVYMYDNPRNLPVSYKGQRFAYTPHPGGRITRASDAVNVATAMEVQLLPGRENGAGSSPSASPYFDVQIGDDDVPDLESYFDLRLDTNQTLNGVSRPDKVQTISLLYVNVGAIAKVNLQASDNEVRFVSSSTTFTEESGEVEIEIEVVHPTRFKDDRDSTGTRFNAWPNDGIRVHVDATEMTTDLRATNFPRLNQPADSWFTYDDRGYHTTLEWGQPRFLAHDGGAWQFGSNASEGFLGDGHADFSNQRRGDLFIPARDPARTGDISQKVSIRLNVWDDNVAEDEETYTIYLREATNYRSDNPNDPYPAEGGWGLSDTRNAYTITIPANDNYVTLTGSHNSISESGMMTTLDLTLSNPAPTGGVPLVLSIPDGNPDASFEAARQVYTKDVMIDAGDTEATNIPLFINGNQMHQPVARNVVVSVAKAQENFPNVWGDILSHGNGKDSHTIAIEDDDAAPIENLVGFRDTTMILRERHFEQDIIDNRVGLPLVVTGTASGIPPFQVMVNVSGAAGDISFSTASGEEVPATPGLNAVSVQSGTIMVIAIHDNDQERVEEVTLTLPLEGQTGRPNGWGIDPDRNRMTLRIDSNDGFVDLSGASNSHSSSSKPTINEGGVGRLIFRVSGNPLIPQMLPRRFVNGVRFDAQDRSMGVPIDISIFDVQRGNFDGYRYGTVQSSFPAESTIEPEDVSFSPDEQVHTKRIWHTGGRAFHEVFLYTKHDMDIDNEEFRVEVSLPLEVLEDRNEVRTETWCICWGWGEEATVDNDLHFVIRDSGTTPSRSIGFSGVGEDGVNRALVPTGGGSEGTYMLRIAEKDDTPFPDNFTLTLRAFEALGNARTDPPKHDILDENGMPIAAVVEDGLMVIKRTVSFAQGETEKLVALRSKNEEGALRINLEVDDGDTLPVAWNIGTTSSDPYSTFLLVAEQSVQNNTISFTRPSGTATEGQSVDISLTRTNTALADTVNLIPSTDTAARIPALFAAGSSTATARYTPPQDDIAEVDETVTFTIDPNSPRFGSTIDGGANTFTLNVNPSDNFIYATFARRLSSGGYNRFGIGNRARESFGRIGDFYVYAENPLATEAKVQISPNVNPSETSDSSGQVTINVRNAPNCATGTVFNNETGVLTLPPYSIGRYCLEVHLVNDDVAEHPQIITFTLSEVAGNPLPEGWAVRSPPPLSLPSFDDVVFFNLPGRNPTQNALRDKNYATVVASDNTIGWAATQSTYTETTGQTTEVRFEISINKPPVETMRLRMEITGNTTQDFSGFSVASESATGMIYNSGTGEISIPPVALGSASTPRYVIIGTARDDNVHEPSKTITLTLREPGGGINNGLPEGWEITEGNRTHTITVEDDDPSSSPPRLPDPIRPPKQETSPKPPDEFPKEAKANP